MDQIPKSFGPSVTSLGNYDGMHLGHQYLIEQVVERARATGRASAVITFDPHPATLHRPDEALVPIQSLQDRLEAMGAMGLDAVWVQPYTEEFAALTAAQFVQQYLVDGLQATEVVVGHDVRFGAGNQGNLQTMQALGQELDFAVTAIDDQGDREERTVSRFSSSGVRASLAAGDVAHAAQILGRPHRVTGEVVYGDGRGHTLGFPTANLGGVMTGTVPADAVYAGWLIQLELPPDDADKVLPAAISVGTNPTFGGRERRVEAFVPGRIDLKLYGQQVALDFVGRLRHTLEFSTTTALVMQMHDDAAASLRFLALAGRQGG